MATTDFQLPDIGQLLRQLSLPGVDINALIDSHRKDIEAVAAANQRAYEGLQALVQRQAEMLREALQTWQTGAQDAGAGQSLTEASTRQAEVARKAFEQAVANMRELAEMAARSQAQAYEVIHQRLQERLGETLQQFQPKNPGAAAAPAAG